MSTIDELKQAIQAKKQELAGLRSQLSNVRVSYNPAKRTDAEQSALDEKQLRAGAEALMQWNPTEATNMLQRAEQIRTAAENKRLSDAEKAALKQEKLDKENDPKKNIDDLRATHNTYLNLVTALVNQGRQKDDPELVQARGIVTATAAELRKLGLPIGTPEELAAMSSTAPKEPPKAPEVYGDDMNKKIEEARRDAKIAIATSIDKNKNGIIDNEYEIATQLTDIAYKYGINLNSKEWNSILDLFKAKKDVVDKEASKAEEKRRTGVQETNTAFSQFKDYVPVINARLDVLRNPNATNRSVAVGQMLKILSGMGVSDKERINTMVSMTNDAYQNDFNTREKQYKEAFIGKFIGNDQALISEISNNVDPKKIAEKLRANTPKQAEDWFSRTQATTEKPQAQDQSRLDKIRQLRGKK